MGAALISTGAVGVVVPGWQQSRSSGFTAGPWPWWIAHSLFATVLVLDARLPGRRWRTALVGGGRHISSILGELGARDRTHALLRAISLGLVGPTNDR